MAEKLLYTYMKITKKKFDERMRELSMYQKLLMGIMMLSAVGIPICVFYEQGLYITICMLFCISTSVLLDMQTWTLSIENWKSELDKYNKLLDDLRNVLKSTEYNLYEKNKIKQIIRKLKCEMYEEKNKIRENKFFNIITVLVFPVIFYIGNNLDKEKSIFVVIYVCTILAGYYILCNCSKQTYEMLRGEPNYKRKQLVQILQDLLDRDFEIGDNDLICIEK